MKKLSLFLISLIFFSISCEKDDEDNNDSNNPPVVEVNFKVKRVERTTNYTNGGEEYQTNINFEYDSQNRIKKLHYDDGDGDVIFTYSGNLLEITFSDDGENGLINCELDENGNVISIEVEDMVEGEDIEITYDSKGYMTRYKSYCDGGLDNIETFLIESGNIVTHSYSYCEEDTFIYNMTYYHEYYNTSNRDFIGINPFRINSLFGKNSKNLVKTKSYFYDYDFVSSSFSYDFDDKGRVIKSVEEQKYENVTVFTTIKIFTYY